MLTLLLKFIPVVITSLFLSTVTVFAHEGEEEVEEIVQTTLENTVRSNSIKVVIIASSLIILFVILTILLKNAGEQIKKFLFAGIVIPTLVASLFIIGSTFYLNFSSSTGGPVHWHADLEVWDCGTKLDFVDPEGISNKVGSSTFHEHNDGRIHVEGVVTKPDEVSLGKFFQFIGGSLTSDEMRVPTNNGLIIRHSGDWCDDGNKSVLQVFVYKTHDNTFSQTKLRNPASYILSPESAVPPGDCIIVEFSESKERTDKLCHFYKLKQQLGEIKATPGETLEPSKETPNLDIPTSTPSSLDHHHEEEVAPHGH